MRIRHTVDLANATLQQYRLLERLAPNEFTTLQNWIAEKGALVARPSFALLETVVKGNSVQGLYSWKSGTNSQWLLAAVADSADNKTKMVAFLVDMTQTGTSVIRNAIVGPAKTAKTGQSYCFVEYRGAVYASNGSETAKFDGERWVGFNNQNTDTAGWRVCADEIAFKTACVFGEHLVIGNTPHYPNEVTWGKVYADIGIGTKWTGNEEIGAFSDTGITDNLTSIAFYGNRGYIGGEAEALATTTNGGGLWSRRGPAKQGFSPEDLSLSVTKDWLMLTASGQGHTLYYSDDSGATFDKVTYDPSPGLEHPARIAMSTDTVGIVVGYHAQFLTGDATCWITANGWTSAVAGVVIKAGDVAVSYWPIDLEANSATTYWCLVDGKSFTGTPLTSRLPHYTTDSGATWTEVFSVSNNCVALSSYSGDYRKVLAVGLDGKIQYTADAGATAWATHSAPTAYDLLDVVWTGSNSAVAVGENGTVAISTDVSGGAWTAGSIDGVTGALRKLIYANGKLWAVGDGGIVITSEDGGANWSVDEPGKNKLDEALYLAPGEEIRALYPLHGLMYVFTNRNAYAFDSQFAQRNVTTGFSALNHNCVQEYAGAIWVFGHYNGVPGVYAWDGQSAPALMSRPIQDYIDAATVEPSPKDMEFKFDSDEDFTPRIGGLFYGTNRFGVDDGVLKMRQIGDAAATIFSHGIGAATQDDTTGFYMPDIVADYSNFGWLNIELALTDDATTPQTYCKVQVRAAKTSSTVGLNGEPQPDAATWTTWIDAVPDDVDVFGGLPYTGQDAVFGRYSLNLDHTQFTGRSGNTYNWFQFKIIGYNATGSNTNWAINRISFRPQLNTGIDSDANILSPALAVWDGKLFATIPSTGFYIAVFSNGGRSVSTMTSSRANALCPHLGKLFIGSRTNAGAVPRIVYSIDQADYQQFTSTLQTGRIGFDAGDQAVRHLRKTARRILLGAKPLYGGSGGVTVYWWADGRSGNYGSKTLTFDSAHDPDNGLYQLRSIELHSGPASDRGGGTGTKGALNTGHDFTVKLVTNSGDEMVLEHLAIEADTTEMDVRETDAEA